VSAAAGAASPEGHPAVGVVGTGLMGMGVVRSLRRHGVLTFARDIDAAKMAEAASLGAAVAASSPEVARQSDVVILLVVDDVQIDEVLFAEGMAKALRQGAILVVSSTVDPQYVAALPQRLGHGIHVLDAPVSGGPAKAHAGTMTLMVSGAAAARERCAGVFAAIAGNVFAVGERPGQAMTYKIVNNLLAAANLAAGAQALVLAQRAGIDPAQALEVIDASSGASWIVAERMARELAGDRGVRAATKVLAKDVAIAAALAQRVGAPDSFARAAVEAFRGAVAAGYGEEDDAALLRFFAARR
jgi:3-hydroxyisobutyrate dehydrogenase-like beta-hydroxyacid dehydrogenase